MKRLFFSFLVTVFCPFLFAQVVTSARTGSGYVNITKEPPKPAYIEIVPGSITFIDSDGNLSIDANEKAFIHLELKNSGQGPGLNLNAVTTEKNNVPGISYTPVTEIGTLQPGQTTGVIIPVSGSMANTDSKAMFTVTINEVNGFGTDPVIIEVPVRAFVAPMIKIVDYKITSQSGRMIEKRMPFEVQVLLQNIGQGTAEHILISLPVPEEVFCLTGNAAQRIEKLLPGEQKLLEYAFVTTNNYTLNEIKLAFQLQEKHDRYAEDKLITIAMHQQVASEKLVVIGIVEESKEIKVASLSSSVDRDIPVTAGKKANRVALIIGNENYSGRLNPEINVDYAAHDAAIFRQYVIQTLQVSEKNVFFAQNATAGEMRALIERVARLMERMGTDSELIFYYAGHGYPDENSRIPYLIPVDVNAASLSSAIRLSEVYTLFGKSGASRITVFLDACFSGGGRNLGLMASRGIRIRPRQEDITGNMVVYSATTGEQTALPYHTERHGLFTYYLLKKLQETGGNVSYGDLARYLSQTVSVTSLRDIGREQDPEVNVSTSVAGSWMLWNMKE